MSVFQGEVALPDPGRAGEGRSAGVSCPAMKYRGSGRGRRPGRSRRCRRSAGWKCLAPRAGVMEPAIAGHADAGGLVVRGQLLVCLIRVSVRTGPSSREDGELRRGNSVPSTLMTKRRPPGVVVLSPMAEAARYSVRPERQQVRGHDEQFEVVRASDTAGWSIAVGSRPARCVELGDEPFGPVPVLGACTTRTGGPPPAMRAARYRVRVCSVAGGIAGRDVPGRAGSPAACRPRRASSAAPKGHPDRAGPPHWRNQARRGSGSRSSNPAVSLPASSPAARKTGAVPRLPPGDGTAALPSTFIGTGRIWISSPRCRCGSHLRAGLPCQWPVYSGSTRGRRTSARSPVSSSDSRPAGVSRSTKSYREPTRAARWTRRPQYRPRSRRGVRPGRGNR